MFAVAIVALGGSLYYSLGANFVPCELCWYQRIGIYPLSLLLLVAIITSDRSVRKYVVPMTIITAFVSVWHILVQRVPGLEKATQCQAGVPCSGTYIDVYGAITIPVLALATTVTIGTIMWLVRPQPKA